MPLLAKKHNVLYIDNNGSRLQDGEFQSVLDALQRGQPVSSIVLNNAGFDKQEFKALCQCLAAIKTKVVLLNLDCNNIWPDMIRDLVEVLLPTSNSAVIELQLDHNHVGDEGAVYLAQGIKNNPYLTALSLNQNAIGDVGCEALSGAVAQNAALVKLSLQANRIEEVGAITLANMLAGLGLLVGEEVPEDEGEPETVDTKKGGKKKGGKPEQKTEEQLEKERREKEEKEAKRKQAHARRAVALCKNESLIELYLDANMINVEGYKVLEQGVINHPNMLELSVDELNGRSFAGAHAARQAIYTALKANQRKRVAVIQHAFFMGLHPRVGCCSPIRQLIDDGPADFDLHRLKPLWDFLGPV